MAEFISKGNPQVTRDELMQLDKNELVDKLLQYQKHNIQLKNIISKSESEKSTNGTRNIKKKKPFDFTKHHYRRILLRIMYFGWDYRGYVVQEDTTNTIEHHLMHALVNTCLIETREKAQYHRCGRTDKGVSAFGQVISLTIRSKYSPEDMYKPEAIESELPYCTMLNRQLPDEIRAVAWMPIPADKPEYSARFDCTRRVYKYYFPRAGLDITAMRDACARLIGEHDFRNLCKMDVGNGVVRYTRRVTAADVVPVGGEGDGRNAMHCLRIEGTAFLWHQIRCVMGVLLLVGEGREEPSVISELLDVRRNTRKPQYQMALDVPLNLFKCSYGIEETSKWVFKRNELKRIIKDYQSSWTVQHIKSTMMSDCLRELESVYSSLKEEIGGSENELEGESDGVEYVNCLVPTTKCRVYKRLLERQTCSSLEEKVEHYKRKKKFNNKFKEEEEEPAKHNEEANVLQSQ